jgi:hypothetical protein
MQNERGRRGMYIYNVISGRKETTVNKDLGDWIILRWIFKKAYRVVWTGLVCLR